MKLSDKQQRFCMEYLVDLNATQAAIRSGYSEKTARQIGTENLSKPAIQERIKALQADRSQRTQITSDDVISRLRNIADLWETNPSSAVRALELLGKHLGIFERDNRQSQELVIQIVNYAGEGDTSYRDR